MIEKIKYALESFYDNETGETNTHMEVHTYHDDKEVDTDPNFIMNAVKTLVKRINGEALISDADFMKALSEAEKFHYDIDTLYNEKDKSKEYAISIYKYDEGNKVKIIDNSDIRYAIVSLTSFLRYILKNMEDK